MLSIVNTSRSIECLLFARSGPSVHVTFSLRTKSGRQNVCSASVS